VKPGVENKSSLKQANEKLMKEIREDKAVAGKRDAYLEKIQDIKERIAQYRKSAITNSEFDFFRETLRDMGNEYNVKVIRDRVIIIDDSNKSVFKNNLAFTEKEISLKLVCGYHDFGSFINRIENTSPFRKITDFSIGKDKKDALSIDVNILSLLFENPV
jgi:Tfp pilus assembly protein PilO